MIAITENKHNGYSCSHRIGLDWIGLNWIGLLRTSGRISENIYSFTAEANDNKARFRCEASNIMSQTPLKAEVDLTVMCKYFIIVFGHVILVGCVVEF